MEAGLTSNEHFTVDGSLIQSRVSLTSLKRIEREAADQDDDADDPPRRGRNPSVDFKGERRTNSTHRSTTDPEANLYKKGDDVGAFLSHSAHAITENRYGLVMSVRVDGPFITPSVRTPSGCSTIWSVGTVCVHRRSEPTTGTTQDRSSWNWRCG